MLNKLHCHLTHIYLVISLLIIMLFRWMDIYIASDFNSSSQSICHDIPHIHIYLLKFISLMLLFSHQWTKIWHTVLFFLLFLCVLGGRKSNTLHSPARAESHGWSSYFSFLSARVVGIHQHIHQCPKINAAFKP